VAPPLIFSFLSWNKLCETGDPSAAIEHATAKMGQTLVASYFYWCDD
jgi:hypothetical protein